MLSLFVKLLVCITCIVHLGSSAACESSDFSTVVGGNMFSVTDMRVAVGANNDILVGVSETGTVSSVSTTYVAFYLLRQSTCE